MLELFVAVVATAVAVELLCSSSLGFAVLELLPQGKELGLSYPHPVESWEVEVSEPRESQVSLAVVSWVEVS